MIDKRQLIVCDIESTGLDTGHHWPVEVAAINVYTGDELYFVPDLPRGALDEADGDAMRINRYFERRIFKQRLSKPDSDNRWQELWELLRGNTFAGANPTFDSQMFNRGYTGHGPGYYTGPGPWHYRLADLSAYAAGALHLAPNELVGLADICERLDVANEGEHTALGDARATAECFRILAHRYTDKAVTTA